MNKTIQELIRGAINRGSIKAGGDDSLKRDGDKIICVKCTIPVTFTRNNINSRINEHFSSKRHQSNKNKQATELISEQSARAKERKTSKQIFQDHLLNMMVSCDIPLHKLKMKKFESFLTKYIPNHKIPKSQSMRNKLEPLANDMVSNIREEIGDADVHFQVDETGDRKSRNVMNVMVGKLDDSPTKPMLLHVDFQTVTNSKTIQLAILHACKLLWPDTNILRCC